MKGLVFDEINTFPVYKEVNIESASDDQVSVSLLASSLNHRDVWITKGMYPGIKLPTVLGSDGAGLYDGREVIINPNINWGINTDYQGKDYQVLGMPTQGTFAESVVVNKDRLHDKPAHLNFLEAAALPLTGLTAYRALFTKGCVKEGNNVLINGIGGGVALMAFQLAIAAGANVYISSGSSRKLDRGLSLGAVGGVKYTDPDWHKELLSISGGIDIVIDGAGGDGVGELIYACNPGARFVMYGGSRGKINNISPQLIFWRQVSLIGSTMGNDQEFSDMLDFVIKHQIKPIIDTVIPLSEGEDGFERMDSGLQFGKIIFNNLE